jgi:F-box and leucine-rich repeat protein 14
MATLKALGQLESLTFYDCRGITDEGVSHLAELTGLKSLRFQSERLLRRPRETGPCITDAGVAHFKRLVQLEHLDLFGHDVSDASVGILNAMTELQTLALSGHGFTDAGLEGLARLPKLRELRLFETAVSTNGIARVKARLPELQIQAWDRDGQG